MGQFFITAQVYLLRQRTDLRALGRDEAGASAVEFALLAPVLALLLAGTIDSTVLILRNMEVRAAAQAGADYALAKGWDAASVATAVTKATNSPLTISATPAPTVANGCIQGFDIVAPPGAACADSSTPGRYVTVNAQAPFQPLVPLPGVFAAKTLTARAVVRIP